ncbi:MULTISPECIES: 6,7-dimethyl-8-ribityllumazine synthase [unclassified Brevibacterium]|uniref:6,7-dimethyl-8-ribityllumazine synthase n=1 Tax=unclassified Brevibacterium TaxID=2614124 RepID=UPI0008A4575A|nr:MULTISPECIES: 6,7-dimethyl-8-ribityllumazine synthase [unclassified Brevibacterium]OFS27420.1 6,7-dimethyl-8-ribityllumazine synthase [Brevibacterium sp. HMSC07C04]
MAGHGAPEISPRTAVQAGPLSMAIIASRWHDQVMGGLVAGAQRAAAEAGIDAPVHWVPGSFELPIAAQAAAKQYDCVVALGVVIRGGTPHFDYVCTAATDGLGRVALDSSTPVGFGLLTCDTEEQALDRAGLEGSKEDKGYEAATAALATADVLRRLR